VRHDSRGAAPCRHGPCGDAGCVTPLTLCRWHTCTPSRELSPVVCGAGRAPPRQPHRRHPTPALTPSARAATSSAQTPGSYGLHDGKAIGKAFSFTLPKADPAVPAPSMAEGLKVPGFLKPPTVTGLVLSLVGALHPLNLTQLAGNITTQCAPLLPQRLPPFSTARALQACCAGRPADAIPRLPQVPADPECAAGPCAQPACPAQLPPLHCRRAGEEPPGRRPVSQQTALARRADSCAPRRADLLNHIAASDPKSSGLVLVVRALQTLRSGACGARCRACADPAAARSLPALAERGRRAQGDCPAGLHARCSTCQVSLAGPSQCLACFSPFVLHHDSNFCGCAIGSTLARDPASQQETWCARPRAAQRC